MPDRLSGSEHMLRRWRSVSPRDRDAILEALSDDRREQFEEILAEAQAQLDTDKQFLAYSAWLGKLVAHSVAPTANPAPTGAVIKPAVRAALAKAHGDLAPAQPDLAASANALARMRRSFSDWLARP